MYQSFLFSPLPLGNIKTKRVVGKKKPRKVTNNMIPNNHRLYAYTMRITPKNISKIPSLISDAYDIFQSDFSK